MTYQTKSAVVQVLLSQRAIFEKRADPDATFITELLKEYLHVVCKLNAETKKYQALREFVGDIDETMKKVRRESVEKDRQLNLERKRTGFYKTKFFKLAGGRLKKLTEPE
jgi:hypothetical protein